MSSSEGEQVTVDVDGFDYSSTNTKRNRAKGSGKRSNKEVEMTEMNGVEPQDVSVKMGFSRLEAPELPLMLEFRNLTYTISRKPTKDNPSKERVILNKVSGFAHPGEMVAIMGPTGSGKTTLLNVLARRVKSGVTGELLINGKPATKEVKRHLAYVLQDDILLQNFTVQETLEHQALLRQPGHLTREEKLQKVDEVIDVLKLNKARNTIIGGPMVRGVSGGERKRVNIGTQLLSNPSMIFLDEPTSGLDTSTAIAIIKTMKEIARSGYTVLCTIHQPSSQIYELFDKLLLLVDGHVVYFGPPLGAVTYLKTLNLECPPNYNPADFIMGVILEEEISGKGKVSETKQRLIKAWQDHGPYPYDPAESKAKGSKGDKIRRRVQEEVKQKSENLLQQVQQKAEAYDKPKYPISWFEQTRILSRRAFKQARHTYLQKLPIIQQIIVALIVGAVWFQSPFVEERYRDHMGTAFFIIVFSAGFSPMLDAIFNFPTERVVIAREKAEGAYQLSAYFISKVLMDLAFMFILPIGFACVTYWMAGLRPSAASFFMFVAVSVATTLACSGFGLIISASVYNLRKASVSGTVGMLLFMLIGGFYVPVTRLPVWFAWTKYFSPIKYSYDATIITQFEGREIPGPSNMHGDDIVASVAPIVHSVGFNVLILIGWGIVYRIIAFIALKLSLKRKK